MKITLVYGEEKGPIACGKDKKPTLSDENWKNSRCLERKTTGCLLRRNKEQLLFEESNGCFIFLPRERLFYISLQTTSPRRHSFLCFSTEMVVY